jgi:hypothetical protein
MLQSSLFDSVAFDPFAFQQDVGPLPKQTPAGIRFCWCCTALRRSAHHRRALRRPFRREAGGCS